MSLYTRLWRALSLALPVYSLFRTVSRWVSSSAETTVQLVPVGAVEVHDPDGTFVRRDWLPLEDSER